MDVPAKVGAAVRRSTWRLEDCLKEREVEELVDWYFHRPIAFWLIRPLEHTATWVTPVQITLASMVLGVIGGVCCFLSAAGPGYWSAVGGALVFASVILDCADGQLARLRGGGTTFGMLLDGCVDGVVGVSFWFGLAYAATRHQTGPWVWPLAVLILLSIFAHVVLYDQFKNSYLRAVGASPPVRDSVAPGRFERAASAFYQRCYAGFFRSVGGEEAPPRVDAATYRAAFAGPMRIMSFLGLGTHLGIMYVVAIVASVVPQHTFGLALFSMVGVLNVVMVVALVWWKWVEYRLGTRTAGGEASEVGHSGP